MSNPVKISDALNLAIHALVVVSSNEQKRVNTTEIANICGVSSNHLAKVMQRLVHGGILKSVRGPSGGFTLLKNASDITLMDVYRLIEGEFTPLGCLLGKKICGGDCVLSPLSKDVNGTIKKYFEETTIESMLQRSEKVE